MRESLLVGTFGIVGTAAGKYIATSSWFSKEEFLLIISIVFLYTGFNFIRKSLAQKSAAEGIGHVDREITPVRATGIGGAGGFVAALSGLGGGVLMVPIMNMGYKFSLRKSVSVSEFAIVLISLAGFIQFGLRSPLKDLPSLENVVLSVSSYTVGYIDFGVCLPLVIGAFIGAGFGVRLHDKINTKYIKMIFGVLVILVAARMASELW